MVGLHCPLDELERRELARGDRRIGQAKADFATTHVHCEYDIELNGMDDLGTSEAGLVTASGVQRLARRARCRAWPPA